MPSLQTATLAFCLVSVSLLSACKKESEKTSNSTNVVTTTADAINGVVSNVTTPAVVTNTVQTTTATQLAGTCRIAVDCQQALPSLEAATGFKHNENKLKAALRNPVHRGRDALIVEGQDPQLIAKFAYTIAADADIEGEDVDIFQSKGCVGGWNKIGTVATSVNNSGRVVDGVEDTGGYIMAPLSSLGVTNLTVGRHRFLLVLKANNEVTELYVEVMPKKNALIVTDIDGTLTSFEEAAASHVISVHPESHVGAADMVRSFYHRGYNIFYLTARPTFLMASTREWLNVRGFPPGAIHTTTFKASAMGEAAAAFKAAELAAIKTNLGVTPQYAFGNKPSDVKAFADSGIPTDNSYYYEMVGDSTGAKIQKDYRTLVPMAQAAPSFWP